ncbi:hypothetical protein [Castellaniella sp.]|uniref:hypothetical protein n=1 Tax=Castellaniella sp. TaxID=1955812 RepID=UPI003A92F798
MSKYGRNEIANILGTKTGPFVDLDSSPGSVVTDGLSRVRSVLQVEKVGKQIRMSKEDLFDVIPEYGRRAARLQPHGSAAGALLGLLHNGWIVDIAQLYEEHRMSPRFYAVHDAIRSRNLDCCADRIRSMSGSELHDLAASLNDAVFEIRQRLRSAEFAKAVVNFEGTARKNHRSLSAYVSNLFRLYPAMRVLRFDLGYLDSLWSYGTQNVPVSLREMRMHRDKFLRTISMRLAGVSVGDPWLGYAWKLDCGVDTSLRLHMLAFLNPRIGLPGEAAQAHIDLCWRGIVGPDGRCLHYRQLGSGSGSTVGMVLRGDAEGQRALRRAVLYMTKADYLVKSRLLVGTDVRTFGKGQLPKKRRASRGQTHEPCSTKTPLGREFFV